MLGAIGRRLVSGAEKHVIEVAKQISVTVAELRGIEPRYRCGPRWSIEGEEGGAISLCQVPAVGGRQRIARRRRGYQFQLGAVGELHVLVADAVIVRTPGLQREPEG